MDQNKEIDLKKRRNQVGGQALIEGVMMKHGDTVAIAVRKVDGSVEIRDTEFVSVKKKHKWLNIPIIRGIIGFVESLIMSVKTMNISTDMLGLDELEEKEKKEKAEKKLRRKAKKEQSVGSFAESSNSGAEAESDRENCQPDKTAENLSADSNPVSEPEAGAEQRLEEEKKKGGFTVLVTVFSLVLGFALAILLFNILPTYVAGSIEKLFNTTLNRYLKALVEGLIKIIVFILYILSVSFMKDIKRTFQYHGAEHKSIACYEKGLPLTPENAKNCTRFHPRCGTSFLFVMILIGILVGMFIPFWDRLYLRMILKLLVMPVVVGIGYEFIMYAGKHENLFTKICSAPGLWMQRLTTKEPDETQLAIAICAIKSSMKEEFPDFDKTEYYIPAEQNTKHLMYEPPKESKK